MPIFSIENQINERRKMEFYKVPALEFFTSENILFFKTGEHEALVIDQVTDTRTALVVEHGQTKFFDLDTMVDDVSACNIYLHY